MIIFVIPQNITGVETTPSGHNVLQNVDMALKPDQEHVHKRKPNVM